MVRLGLHRLLLLPPTYPTMLPRSRASRSRAAAPTRRARATLLAWPPWPACGACRAAYFGTRRRRRRVRCRHAVVLCAGAEFHGKWPYGGRPKLPAFSYAEWLLEVPLIEHKSKQTWRAKYAQTPVQW